MNRRGTEGTPVVPSQHVSLGSGDQPDQCSVCQRFCGSWSWLLTNSFVSGLCGHCPQQRQDTPGDTEAEDKRGHVPTHARPNRTHSRLAGPSRLAYSQRAPQSLPQGLCCSREGKAKTHCDLFKYSFKCTLSYVLNFFPSISSFF